jgi:hypothetical protein
LISQLGSLSHWFVILDKAQLGSPHPNYHTLLAALMQILNGIILNAWQVECGHLSLAAFLESNLTPQQLLDMAHEIWLKHTVPIQEIHPSDDDTKDIMPVDLQSPLNPDEDIA